MVRRTDQWLILLALCLALLAVLTGCRGRTPSPATDSGSSYIVAQGPEGSSFVEVQGPEPLCDWIDTELRESLKSAAEPTSTNSAQSAAAMTALAFSGAASTYGCNLVQPQ